MLTFLELDTLLTDFGLFDDPLCVSGVGEATAGCVFDAGSAACGCFVGFILKIICGAIFSLFVFNYVFFQIKILL